MMTESIPEVPPVERIIAFDMVRRSVPFVVAAALTSWVFLGPHPALSVVYGMALVLVNLVLSACALAWAAKRSLGLLMGVSLFGYILRLGLITVAVLAVRQQSWVEIVPLGITIIITHLGLLIWELRFASISFTFPGVMPVRPQS